MTASRDEMWLRIREYVEACGGHIAGTNHDQTQRRLLAVSRLDDIIRKLVLEKTVYVDKYLKLREDLSTLENHIQTKLPYYVDNGAAEVLESAEDCVRFAAEELAALRIVVPKD